METQKNPEIGGEIELEVNGEMWHQVSTFDNSSPFDNHYAVKTDDDEMAVIRFGDGEHGARPPTKTNIIKVTYSRDRQYRGVMLQLGRVRLDDDLNEGKGYPGRFCGIYRGLVVDNADPESLMRVRVQVPEVLGTERIWALPCIPVGTSVLPTIGKGVWIMFEGENPDRPVWMGTWSCAE